MGTFNKHIFLIGFMGTGKSAIAQQLGNLLGLSVADTDSLIEETSGMSIPELFQERGEDYFRKLETEVLRKLAFLDRKIVSCGGGVPLKRENKEIIKKTGNVVLLTASAETIYMRVKEDTQRPLLKDNMNINYIEELMKKRQPEYDRTADIIIKTDGRNFFEICEEIVSRLKKLEDTE